MLATLPNEDHLIRSLQTDQVTGFSTLYDAYAPTLYGFLVGVVRDSELAEDLLQDAFVKIWSKRHTYNPKQGRLFTWLMVVTRNLARDELRARKVRLSASSYLAVHSEWLSNPTPCDGRLTTTLISQLAPKYRVIIDLYFERNYTFPEIAAHLTLPLGTVKTRYRKALQELKEFFSQDIYYYQLHLHN
ncbi:sigma-70 family RNA polymerase sigma factor [Spirosoma sp. HMF4905]|uniref:RNA polymerase sigma factor n=1 Tax=Spirosoma arboris TaxID=2682092 RepID=A0A7K1SNY3_9BACT|nr:sigma-70 family RNA polymerase sigma factor [Spirosoma arboris]MVM35515.1 sigma-70 family RNA polymerase sigma factor [Spirosoma arboris]